MRNKIMLMGIVCISLFTQENSAFHDEREDRKHAHILVKYMYAHTILQKFEDGNIGTENRKRLRDDILDECPLIYHDANKRSLAALLVWRERRFLQGEPLN